MRHSNSGRKFSRSSSHRKAMFMNLAKALIMHGRIRTTEMRAKDLRGIVERLVTLAKRNDLHARRLAYRELNDHAIVKHLFDQIGPIFAEVPGGYTRVLRLAKHRKGDNAPMAIIEFSRSQGGNDAKPVKTDSASSSAASSEAGANAAMSEPAQAVSQSVSESSTPEPDKPAAE